MIKEYLNDHSLKEEFVTEKMGWILSEAKITIPVYDEGGKLIFSRYRQLKGDAKFTSDKGAHPALYCLHKVKNIDTVVLCEGEIDAARLWQEEIPAITGTSGVKTFSTKLAKPLKGKNIILCLDTDEAGSTSIEHYCNILTQIGCTVSIKQLPEEFKDVSEYFTSEYSKDDFNALPILSIDDWYDQNTPEEFKLETIKEISEQDIPDDEWLVDRILPAEGFTFIVGAEATGKSFYTLTLAKAVATGTAWLGETALNDEGKALFPVKEKQNVLIIDKENTKRRRKSRAEWLEMSNIDNIFYHCYPHFFQLADQNEEYGLSKIAKETSRQVKNLGIKFIVVDSFTDVMIGNENASGDVQAFFDAMRMLFPGTSILVLHHASKPAQGVYRTSAQRARGSTNIMAQVYSAFYIEAMPKSKTEFTMEQTKSGDALKLSKFMLELDVRQIEESGGKTKVGGILYKGFVPDEEMKVTQAESFIEEIFKDTQIHSRQELLDACIANSVSERTARRAIKNLVKAKKIDEVSDSNGDGRKKSFVWIDNYDSNEIRSN